MATPIRVEIAPSSAPHERAVRVRCVECEVSGTSIVSAGEAEATTPEQLAANLFDVFRSCPHWPQFRAKVRRSR